MMLIGVTTMRTYDASRQEWHDALDDRWPVFLKRCGISPLYLPNSPETSMRLVERLRPRGLLLTGGGNCAAVSGTVDARDATESALLDLADALRLPVFGVCRGMQVMLARSGGRLERVTSHVGEHTISTADEDRVVNSFHDYGFRQVPDGYSVLATAADGVVEAVSDAQRRHAAIMWHPERARTFDGRDALWMLSIFGANT